MYYSQEKQDKYLEENVFKGHKNGFFVDVGAHNGVAFNNTLYFEKNNNWTGINIEPIKNVFNKLVENRPTCINYNCAVDDKNGETEFITNTGYTEMLSGIKSHYDNRHENRLRNENITYGGQTEITIVPTKRLESIFDENNIKNVNYLSIDVEGGEEAVIRSINFDKVLIDVIGFENNYPDKSIPIVEYLETKQYKKLDYSGLDIMMIHKKSIFSKY